MNEVRNIVNGLISRFTKEPPIEVVCSGVIDLAIQDMTERGVKFNPDRRDAAVAAMLAAGGDTLQGIEAATNALAEDAQ